MDTIKQASNYVSDKVQGMSSPFPVFLLPAD